jgi:outer membrane protein OmpA-like peptidoglycan-associated protein
MKTMSVALVLAALIGCSKGKAKTASTLPKDDKPKVVKQDKPPPNLTQDQVVSPGLAIGGDILAACGIKAAAPAANPKFDYDKDELAADDRKVLDQIATCLTTGALKGKAVALIGRADPRGTEEYNLGLGSRRAGMVSDYLARLGVRPQQLAQTTRGALDANGTDESSWKLDRRVDVRLD